MFGRGIFGVLATIVLVAIVAGIGIGVYNAGVSEGVAEAARAAQAAGEDPAVVFPPYAGGGYGPGYGYGWGGGGPGFFGILFGILFLFLIFGLIRAAFGWGRWGGGGRGPGGGWESRNERIAEMHRELHKRDEPNAPAG
jgi:hypothetical protein